MVKHLYLNTLNRRQYDIAYDVMQIGDILVLIFLFRTLYLFHVLCYEQNDRFNLVLRRLFYMLGVGFTLGLGYLSYNNAFDDPDIRHNPEREFIASCYAVGVTGALLNVLPTFGMYFGGRLIDLHRLTRIDEPPIEAPRLMV